MPNYIDRRLNPKDKSLGNRQRFIKRVREELKRTINERIRSGRISDADGDHKVPIPVAGTGEPSFRNAPGTGRSQHVLPGNKTYQAGDRLPKPDGGGAGGGQGKGASGDGGGGEDDFQFVLSRDEVLDLFFDDLELPDLVKLNLASVTTTKPKRAGFARTGAPTNINVRQTMRNSYGRRMALQRPKQSQLDRLAEEIEQLEKAGSENIDRIEALKAEFERLSRRRRLVPYVDPVDIRFNRFEQQPIPSVSAVMFCLMDVSGSMGEREKDLAKRFFVLLHLFLKRRYERTDIVFIRHTHEAQEVDEETFFYSTQSGGTVVSSALEEMKRVIAERYPGNEWNIYAAQASDGDNSSGDSENCVRVLDKEIMSLCQYYAYVEIIDEREREIFRMTDNGTSLWKAYRVVSERWSNFQMTRIARPSDIYPVFRQLFARNQDASANKTAVG